MIAGVISQGRAGVPRGILASRLVYYDTETILQAVVLIGTDQLVSASFIADTDTVYAGVMPQVLTSNALFGSWVGGETVFSVEIVADQVLEPEVCSAVDIIHLPDVRIPGVLQTSRYLDGDVV